MSTETPKYTAAPPAPPSPNDPETAAKMEEAAKAERKAKGRASTIFTGGAGVLPSAETSISKRVLLGT